MEGHDAVKCKVSNLGVGVGRGYIHTCEEIMNMGVSPTSVACSEESSSMINPEILAPPILRGYDCATGNEVKWKD